MLKLTIGKLNIQLNGVDAEQIPDNTLLFRSDFQGEADLTYTIRIGENPPVVSSPVIYRAKDIMVFGKPDGLEARLLYMPDSRDCYAYYEEISEKEINIYVNGAYLNHLKIDTIFISLLALERHEERRGAFIPLSISCGRAPNGRKRFRAPILPKSPPRARRWRRRTIPLLFCAACLTAKRWRARAADKETRGKS